MLRVIELFSGIGAQKQALTNINIDYQVVCTVEWEIAAIIAYHIMHHKGEVSNKVKNMTKEVLVKELSKINLSNDGKKLITPRSLNNMPLDKLQMLYQAINTRDRIHYTDITAIKGEDIPCDVDLMTYSFPCQDLSIGSVFHNGDNNGIKKNGGTRSGLLWEVERLIDEKIELGQSLPRFLLMENVMQVFSDKHKKHFEEWLEKLESIGYYNHFSYDDSSKKWILDAAEFGLPQVRKRAFMLSVLTNNNDQINEQIDEYLSLVNNLTRKKVRNLQDIQDFVFLDKYFDEQRLVHPNYTPSRQMIHGVIIEDRKKYKSRGNPIIVRYDEELDAELFTGQIARTITTKQDRNPNAGLIETRWGHENKKPYRYLTQRECFNLMGFPNSKFDDILNSKIKGLSGEKLYMLAGNSICVPVLEEIFRAIVYIREEIIR